MIDIIADGLQDLAQERGITIPRDLAVAMADAATATQEHGAGPVAGSPRPTKALAALLQDLRHAYKMLSHPPMERIGGRLVRIGRESEDVADVERIMAQILREYGP